MVDITQGDYRIFLSNDNIYLQHLQYNKILTIEKFSSSVYETDQDVLNKVTIYTAIKPHSIIGIVKISSYDFLVYVKVCQLVGIIEGAEIFKIKEIDYVPIMDDITSNNIPSDIKSFLNGMRNLLALGFFYSFHYDLTNSRQRLQKIKSSNIIEHAERKYFWNYALYKKFIEKRLNHIWMTVLICGYVGITTQYVNEMDLGLYLISRRSIHHAGTRYNTRGIDDDGHVANYVETEQIVKISNHILSIVQFRGSVPVFFQQPGLTAQTQITRIPEMTSPAFLKHMEEIQKDCQMIFLVNLMNAHKPNEQIITSNYENQIKINNLKNLRYYFFDFQNECKYDNYDKLDNFITSIENVFNIFKFYCEDNLTGEVHKEQTGIIRTNCLDCLDRTNVIQTRIAWKYLELQLNFLNINGSAIFDNNFLNPKNKVHPIMEAFKELWADNGDFISIQYAGTASTISTVTKNGKHGIIGLFQHGLVSITRFYQGSFEDNFKQKCFEIFLNKNQYESVADPIIQEEIKKYEDKFTSNEDLTIFIGSWNVGGKELKEGVMLFEWLYHTKEEKTADIYIIGLQEIVSLNAKNIMLVSNNTRVDFWRNLIIKNLNEIDKYVLLKALDLVGIYFIVLVKESLKENVRNIESLIVRTGLLGTMGNKGSCLMRFNYLDTSFSIACCHLSAGASNINARIGEINDIINKPFTLKKEIKFKEHDIQFIFGDLNFRIDLDYNTCKQMISSGNLSSLAIYDQLNKTKTVSTSLIDLEEGQLNFDPTYKYIVGGTEYDSKKKRVPSWCDRILYKKNKNIKLLEYDRVDYTHSDHKPIYGLYKITTTKIDEDKKRELIKELKETLSTNMVSTSEEYNQDFSSHINDDFFNSTKLSTNNVQEQSQNKKEDQSFYSNLFTYFKK